MRVDTHVPCRARERLSLSVGDVLLRFRIPILLGHSEIDDVDHIGRLGGGSADEEIIRLDVTINKVLLVDGLNAGELREAVSENDP